MKNITLTLLAAAAIGAVSIGSASAMPFNNVSATLGESRIQNVRVVCDQYGRCYETRPIYRSMRPDDAPRSYEGPAYYAEPTYEYGPPRGYYAEPGYGYGGPGIGIGIGPFGIIVR